MHFIKHIKAYLFDTPFYAYLLYFVLISSKPFFIFEYNIVSTTAQVMKLKIIIISVGDTKKAKRFSLGSPPASARRLLRFMP